MVDVNVFPGLQLRRVTDVTQVRPVDRDPDKNRDGHSAFEEILERERRSLRKKTTEDKTKLEELPVAYGFINFYNGRALNSYFCMLKPTTDEKV